MDTALYLTNDSLVNYNIQKDNIINIAVLIFNDSWTTKLEALYKECVAELHYEKLMFLLNSIFKCGVCFALIYLFI